MMQQSGVNPQMLQQMANNPQMMQQMMQQMGGGGGMPGMGGQMQRAPSGKPVHGEVFEITSLVQLQKIIKDYQGVIIDFWSPTCPPCMSFKPKFESACRGNPNKNIVFCTVNV